MNIEVVSCHDHYLGFPSHIGQKKRRIFYHLVDKVAKKIGGWKEKYFSTRGKEILIKTMAQAVPTYAMSLFKILMGSW